ncbi:MAG TPA: hypothetical protein VJA21_32640 [Verrucomicrobiae bacterium]
MLRRILVGAAIVAALAEVGVLVWLRQGLYHRFVLFPRQEKAWAALREQRQPITNEIGWKEFRGILHSHSKYSHDCEVPFEEILAVLKKAEVDFICLSDHCVNGRADFSLQWRGLREGELFIPGFEMKEGMMPFGVAPGIVLSNATDSAMLARQVVEHGGVLFYAHPEEARAWDRPELAGMEIYNIHADFKSHGGKLSSLLPDLLLNQRRFPDQVFRTLFHRPEPFVRRWDELNQGRHITGIAGNDCHQNTGLRAFYTTNGTVRIEDTSPRTLKEITLNWLTRPLARICFGPLQPNRRLFHVQLDPYERMARFVNTHVWAQDLTEPQILDALRAGRVFVGFDMLADSTGFQWVAAGSGAMTVMGEATDYKAGLELVARSPVPCRFSLSRNATLVFRREGRTIRWAAPGPGKYRVEAELQVAGRWEPWVYANPIELR